jgi:hypothetical protein
MRELNEFNNWAQDIISEAITEKKSDSIERALPVEKNIMYQAQRKYSDRSPEQALNLFLADKLDDFDRRDLDQNKVINRQRQDNERLRSQVGQMSQELQDLETRSAESDAELDRLRTLSGNIRADVEKRQLDTREVQEIMAQIEQLRTKPGVSSEQYEKLKNEVENQIKDFQEKGVDPEKFAEFNERLQQLNASQRIEAEQLRDLENLVGQAEASRARLGATAEQQVEKINNLVKDLENKERRFEKSLRRSGVKYKEFQDKLDKFEQDTIRKNVQQDTIIDAIRDHDLLQDKEIESLGGTAPARQMKLVEPQQKDNLEDFTSSLMSRLGQGQLLLPEPNGDNGAKTTPSVDGKLPPSQPEQPEQELDQEPKNQQGQGLNVLPAKLRENILSEVQMTPEEMAEQQRIAYQYAMKWAPLYYQIWEREPDKRRIIRRYARDDAVDAIFQSVFHWLVRVGRYAVEDENRLWRTSLEILVAQHPYVEYDDLGLDPAKIKGSNLSPASNKPRTQQPTEPQEPVQARLPLDDMKESRLPRKLSQQIDTLAENILGEQYSKYLR